MPVRRFSPPNRDSLTNTGVIQVIECPQCEGGSIVVYTGDAKCDSCYSGLETNGDTEDLVALLEDILGTDPEATEPRLRAAYLTADLLSGSKP